MTEADARVDRPDDSRGEVIDPWLAAQTVGHFSESVAIYDRDSAVVFVNRATERMFGRTLDELRGRRLFEVFPDAVGNPFHQAFERVARTGVAEVFDHYYPPFDAWFANRIYLVGEHVHVVARDVTELVRGRRRLETIARISEVLTADDVDLARAGSRIAAILAEVLEASCSLALLSEDGVWLEVVGRASADTEARDLVAGVQRWRADNGHPAEALRTRRAVLAQHESLIAAARTAEAELRGVIERYAPTSIVVVPLASGETLLGVVVAVRRSGGRPFTEDDRVLGEAIAPSVGLYVAHTRRRAEATELLRVQRALEVKSARQLESLLALAGQLAGASSAEAIARVVVDEGVGALEARMAGMFRLSADGSTAELLREVGYGPDYRAHFARVPLDAGGPVADAFRLASPVWVRSRAEYAARYPALEAAHRPPDAPSIAFAVVPMCIEGRAQACLTFVFHDESRLEAGDRTYLEVLASHGAEALRRARLIEATQSAQREAEAANRAKDEFLAMLGHELRNPLAPIATAVELVRMKEPQKLARECEIIARQVSHLRRMVDDLLDVARVTRGVVELRRERTALAAIVARAVETASALLEQGEHRIEVSIPDDAIVDADPTRLGQVFVNLLSNAARYSARRGRIEVLAEVTGDLVTVRVKDEGVGIAADLLPRIFDPFVQAPQATARSSGGLGLGLAIARSLVEAHGGTIEAASEGLDRGTEVSVRLPVAAPPTSVEAADRGIIRAGAPRRILVVDDNEDAAELLADLLAARGHVVRVAFDAPSALEVAPSFAPDVAVLDIGLPVMDGYELAGRLRAILARVRLVALTGYGQAGDRERAHAAGFDTHMTKPIEVDDLMRAVDVDSTGPTPAGRAR